MDELLADPTTRAFWMRAREHELVVQHCKACNHCQFYPRPLCLVCHSQELEWHQVSGRGTVYSLTTVRIPVLPELEPPYVVVLVELDEGPRFLANAASDLAIGQSVRLVWRDRDGDDAMLVLTAIEEG
jgi:uncharacterized OB-fold protein